MRRRFLKITGPGLLVGLALVLNADPKAQDTGPDGDGRGGSDPIPVSRYYEARITPRGYAIYVPFYLPRRPGAETVAGGEAPTTSTVSTVGMSAGVRTREEIVPGEYVQVYRPAVYEVDGEGRERLVEAEALVTLPKLRIVLEPPDGVGGTRRELQRETTNFPVNPD